MAYNKIVKDGNVLIDLSQDTAVAADVLSPKTFHLASGETATGTIPTKTDADITSSGGVVTIPAGYYAQQYQKQGDPSGDATMTSGDQMLSGITAYSKGTKYTGTIPTKTDADITSEGGVVTIPSGYYAQQYQKQGDPSGDATMTSGDQMLAGVTAYSKGTKYTGTIASQEAMTITPKVTSQTAGVLNKYMTGEITISALYEDVSSTASMDEKLVAANEGKMYKFTGTTSGNYTNGRLYLVEVE